MWACACVLAEAASGDILFNGDSDIGQLFKIFEILGSPGPGKHMAWAGVEALPFYQPIFPNMRPRDLATLRDGLARLPAARATPNEQGLAGGRPDLLEKIRAVLSSVDLQLDAALE